MTIIRKAKENIFIILVFLSSTIFFLLQHGLYLSWDFSAYVLNAKYLFHRGTYFEVFRAPLTPFLLGILLIFKKFGEYLYIIFVSSLFFYANLKLSNFLFKDYPKKQRKTYKLIFYLFSLTPFTLNYATKKGTELLGLALFEIFLFYFLSRKASGHFLGFSFLTRYDFIIFFPFLFFYKNIKIIIKNLLAFLLVIFPWLLFNYLKFGNPFISIIDSYALNFFFRQDSIQKITLENFLTPPLYLLPFLIIGLTISLKKIIKTKSLKNNKIELTILIIATFIIIDFYSTPFKITRYLFNLSLPIAYFSTLGAIWIKDKFKINKRILIAVFLMIFAISVLKLSIHYYSNNFYNDKFESAARDIKKLNISNCEILSPFWTHVAYYTENVYPLSSENLKYLTEQNKIILIFKEEKTTDDLFNQSDINNSPKLYETKDYIFLAKQNIAENCSRKYAYDKPFAKEHCQIIYEKFGGNYLGKLGLKFCKLLNKPILN